jgi:hypothetical protein
MFRFDDILGNFSRVVCQHHDGTAKRFFENGIESQCTAELTALENGAVKQAVDFSRAYNPCIRLLSASL